MEEGVTFLKKQLEHGTEVDQEIKEKDEYISQLKQTIETAENKYKAQIKMKAEGSLPTPSDSVADDPPQAQRRKATSTTKERKRHHKAHKGPPYDQHRNITTSIGGSVGAFNTGPGSVQLHDVTVKSGSTEGSLPTPDSVADDPPQVVEPASESRPISAILTPEVGSQLDRIKANICNAVANQSAVISRLANELRCEKLISPAVVNTVNGVDGRNADAKANEMLIPTFEYVRRDLGKYGPVLLRALNNVGLELDTRELSTLIASASADPQVHRKRRHSSDDREGKEEASVGPQSHRKRRHLSHDREGKEGPPYDQRPNITIGGSVGAFNIGPGSVQLHDVEVKSGSTDENMRKKTKKAKSKTSKESTKGSASKASSCQPFGKGRQLQPRR